MPKSGQAFEVPDAQTSGLVNLVLYHQTSLPRSLNVFGNCPPTPPLSQYFSLSEKERVNVGLGEG